jgi:hypothetical protein
MAGDDIELADMSPGEGAQEGAHRGGGSQLVAQHLPGVAGGQEVDMVNVAASRQGAVDHRHGLGCDVAHTEVDVSGEQPRQIQVLGQGGRQDQSGVGHEMFVAELHGQPVETVRNSHRKGAFLVGSNGDFAIPILPGQEALFASIQALSWRLLGGSGFRLPR